MTAGFEDDIAASKRYSLDIWQHRPWADKLAGRRLWTIKSQ